MLGSGAAPVWAEWKAGDVRDAGHCQCNQNSYSNEANAGGNHQFYHLFHYKLLQIYTDKAVLKTELLFPFSHPGGYLQCLLLPIPIKGDYVVCFLGMQTSLCPDLTVPHGQSKIHCRRWNWCQCWQYNVSFWIFFVCLVKLALSQDKCHQFSSKCWHMSMEILIIFLFKS